MFKTIRKKILSNLRNILFEEWMEGISFFGGNPSASGESVTEDTALKLSVVFSCVKILSETMGTIPLKVFKKTDTGKEPFFNHPLYKILYLQPNPEITSYHWKAMKMSNILLHGNHYCEIQRNRGGRIIALWPLPPNRVKMFRAEDKKIYYRVSINGAEDIDMPANKILHLKGLTLNGLEGLSVLSAAREAIGLGLAGQNSASVFFKNGSQLTGVLEHPGGKGLGLSNPAAKRIRKSWEETHTGIPQQHRIALLEEGMKFRAISISPQDSQLLESRKFSVVDVSRFFRVPLHKINNLEKATNNNIEHQSLEFVMDSISPYTVNFEQEYQIKIFLPSEFGSIYPKYILKGLLRGDIKTRYEGYNKAKNSGWMSADEIRELEDMNNLPDGLGKKYHIPMNMQELGKPVPVKEKKENA